VDGGDPLVIVDLVVPVDPVVEVAVERLQLETELPAERAEEPFERLGAGRLAAPLDAGEALLRGARLLGQPGLRPAELLPLVAQLPAELNGQPGRSLRRYIESGVPTPDRT
jgi:hypothetical protein